MTKTHLVATTLAVLAPIALAQEAAAPAAAPSKPERQMKLAIIYMDRVSSESLLGKGYAKKLDDIKNEIDAEATKKQADLNKLDMAIKALQEDLEKQGSVMSPEAADKKRQEIVRKGRERQAFLEDGQQDLQRMRERGQQQAQAIENEFNVKIRPHIEAVVKEKAIDILLDGRVVPVASKDADISQEVILKSNEAERTAKSAAAKPAAAPQPAAAPTPPPAPAEKP